MKLWLISGIPATGKTVIGDYLEKMHCFFHLDMESRERLPDELKQPRPPPPEDVFNFLKLQNENIVITWGFCPGPNEIQTIKGFQKLGFTFFWFGNNWRAAESHFRSRGQANMQAFHFQKGQVEQKWSDLDSLGPIIVDTFGPDDRFLDKEEIVKKLAKYDEE